MDVHNIVRNVVSLVNLYARLMVILVNSFESYRFTDFDDAIFIRQPHNAARKIDFKHITAELF